ncbi:MAG: ParA family protein [Chloroflexi bacterium]|nr:ParA family protein [Chloroflexota bacterium]
MGAIVAIANQKGGVGKTTSAINLSAYMAARNYRVLLIDLDPQANATSAMGCSAGEGPTVHDVLVRGLAPQDVIMRTRMPKLDLLPSSSSLTAAELELAGMMGREFKLRRALRDVAGEYDYLMIDCPPNLSLLTVNAFLAASKVVVPVQCEYLALEGLSELSATVEMVRMELNPSLTLAGVLMTMYDGRTTLAREVVEEVRRHFPTTLKTVIPRNVKLAEAPSHGLTILEYAPNTPAGKSYQAAADELLAAFDAQGGA